MAKGMRFLHLADLHIGFRVTRFDEGTAGKLREARFQALDNAIQVAEKRDADFILIAGDLFDDNGVSTADATRAFSMLEHRPMPVYVLPGNHDPYCAGSVWQRDPWAGSGGTSIQLLVRPEPTEVGESTVLLPCPVTTNRSSHDPTDWVTPAPGRDRIRIIAAHGTVMDREPLPPDDHPIPADAPDARAVDYIALGHWHSPRTFRARDGAARMAYAGTSEQMSFADGVDTGWREYSSDPECAEFLGACKGGAFIVQIAAPGAAPSVEPVDIGHYAWIEETAEVSDDTFGDLFSAVARRPDPDRVLLRLRLSGVLSIENMVLLESFDQMLNRYFHHEVESEGLHIKPEPGKIAEIVGAGLLRQAWNRLQKRAEAEPLEQQRVTERAMLLLYQMAKEAQR